MRLRTNVDTLLVWFRKEQLKKGMGKEEVKEEMYDTLWTKNNKEMIERDRKK